MEEGVDRISNLPEHLIERILQLLPIKDCVATSVLSTKWRYRWTTIPELVFDDDLECLPLPDAITIDDIIDHVLRSHVGQIHKFKVYYDAYVYNTRAVNGWIRHLSTMPGLKEFIFDNPDFKARKISSDLFAFHGLVHLKLTWCIINLPERFEGLKKLESLDLANITSTQDEIQRLISSSPHLTKLTLVNVDGDDMKYLNIYALNLESVEVVSCFEDINFETPNRLVSVGIGLYRNEHDYADPRTNVSTWSLTRFLRDMPFLHSLKFEILILKYFSNGRFPEKFPHPYFPLKRLGLEMDFSNPKEILVALCFLRSCPNLEIIEFAARNWDDEETIGSFWEEYHSPGPLKQVKFLSFEEMKGTEAQMDFMGFLLSNTPGLKKIKVQVCFSQEVGTELLEKLIKYPRASPQVRLIYEHRHSKADLQFDDEVKPDVARDPRLHQEGTSESRT